MKPIINRLCIIPFNPLLSLSRTLGRGIGGYYNNFQSSSEFKNMETQGIAEVILYFQSSSEFKLKTIFFLWTRQKDLSILF